MIFSSARAGRNPTTLLLILSLLAYKSEQVSYDGGAKDISVMTDTMGNILAVKVHRANLHDTKAGIFPAVKAFVANVQNILALRVDISP